MEIKDLRDQLTQTKTAATAILEDPAHKEGLPAEKKSELDTLMTKLGEQKAALDDAIALEEKKRDLTALDAYLNEPVHRVPLGAVANGGDDARKGLLAAGWEVKSGHVYAPTSFKGGTMVQMYPEEVLFGEVPNDDADAVKYFHMVRASFNPLYGKAWEKYVRMSVKMGVPLALASLTAAEQKALSEGTDTGGGVMVPPDMQAELLVRKAARAVVRRYATVRQTSRDRLQWMRAQPNGSNGSIYTSGFVGSWVGETPSQSDTDPAFGMFDIPVRKLRVFTKVGNDLVMDSASDIMGFLATDGARNMALTEDHGFLQGGMPTFPTTLYPKGLLAAGFATVDVEGSTSNTISNTTSSTGSGPKIIDVPYTLPEQYGDGAIWLMKRSIEGKIRKLVDAQGRFLYADGLNQYGGPGPADRGPRSILNYPVENSEFMPADGTDANQVALFGDLSNYIIADRTMITVRVLNERYAENDQVGFILWERVGGDIWNLDSFRAAIV